MARWNINSPVTRQDASRHDEQNRLVKNIICDADVFYSYARIVYLFSVSERAPTF